jgi:hypothetical protein
MDSTNEHEQIDEGDTDDEGSMQSMAASKVALPIQPDSFRSSGCRARRWRDSSSQVTVHPLAYARKNTSIYNPIYIPAGGAKIIKS